MWFVRRCFEARSIAGDDPGASKHGSLTVAISRRRRVRQLSGLIGRVVLFAVRVSLKTGIVAPRRIGASRSPRADPNDLQVSGRVRCGRLRLPESRAAPGCKNKSFVSHFLDLMAALRVPQEPPLQLKQDLIEVGQQLLI